MSAGAGCRIACFLLAALWLLPAASAHVMSMSNGELRVSGAEAELTAQFPLYEVSHLEHAERAILDSFEIFLNDEPVARVAGSCEAAEKAGAYECEANYRFPAPPEALEVTTRLHETIVPNHVHILRAVRGDFAEQKVFDYAFHRHGIRFAPLTVWDLWRDEAAAGAFRVLVGPAQLLFLYALALASSGRKEALGMAGAFLAAQSLAAWFATERGWESPARFVEAAGALTIAYLAVELLLLPRAGSRWAVAAGMGLFHGLYFGNFLQQSEMSPMRVLCGAAVAEAAVFLLFLLLTWRLKKDFGERPFNRWCSIALLAVGLGWFLTRMGT